MNRKAKRELAGLRRDTNLSRLHAAMELHVWRLLQAGPYLSEDEDDELLGVAVKSVKALALQWECPPQDVIEVLSAVPDESEWKDWVATERAKLDQNAAAHR